MFPFAPPLLSESEMKELAMLMMAPFTIATSMIEANLRMTELIWGNAQLLAVPR